MEEHIKYVCDYFMKICGEADLAERVEGIFERISLLVHGICTVIATTTMDYSNEKVLKIVNDELMDTGKTETKRVDRLL